MKPVIIYIYFQIPTEIYFEKQIREELAQMKVPSIQMESRFGRINIEQTPAKIDIRQTNATQTIEQPKAEMNIKNSKGNMQIDQSQAWEERNLMSTIQLNKRHAQEGLSAIKEGVARRAEQGTQLIKIETGTNGIAEQAVKNGHRQFKQLGIKYVPSPFSVKINYKPGDLNIDIQPRKPIIDVQINKSELSFRRGNVHISMSQYPALQISVIDLYT